MARVRFQLGIILACLRGELAHRAPHEELLDARGSRLSGVFPHDATLQLDAEESEGIFPNGFEKTGDSVLNGPKRLSDWVWVIAPVSFLIFLSISVAAVVQWRSTEQEEAERKRSTQSELHPLLVKWGAVAKSKKELHPESTFLQDLRLAFTARRMGIFFFCLALCFCIARFVDERRFAISLNVPSVTSEADCLWHCRHTKPLHALCGTVKFSRKLCPKKKGYACVEAEEDKAPEIDYVLTPKCSFKVVPAGWKVDAVLCSVIMGIFLIVEGVTTELILIGMACVFASIGIITPKQAFEGYGAESVAGLALLFPVAAAVEETGVLDILIGLLLGNPSYFIVAFFRMMVPVAILSAFLSNTAIVTMLIPIILSWARRFDVSPSKLLMPLSFAAQLGGCCTLIGSSLVMVARTAVDRSVYDMAFFDLAPAGTIVALSSIAYMALCLPLLPAVAASDVTRGPSAALEGAKPIVESIYTVGFQVGSGSNEVGTQKELVKMQLGRLPGVRAVAIEGEGAVEEGAVLMCSCNDTGLVALRRVPGLLIGNHEDLRKMGMGYDRRHRHLYEVVVQQDSVLVGQPMDADAMRQVLGACPIALRGKEPAPSQLPGRETLGAIPAAGDVLLLEADARFVGSTEWTQEFSVTRKVENSTPQRVGGVHDRLRCTLVCVGMVMLCTFTALGVVGITVGAGIFTALLVMTNSMTVEEAYSTIKAPVLFTIAGASALSAALQECGLANFLAGSLTQAAMPLGRCGILLTLYILTAGLSMFMNNAATIAIVGPMLVQIVDDMDGVVSLKSMLFVCVFAAGTCLTTPLGYQTNLMVMKDGGYTFLNFTKYGTPIQILHMLTVLGVILLFRY